MISYLERHKLLFVMVFCFLIIFVEMVLKNKNWWDITVFLISSYAFYFFMINYLNYLKT